MDSSVVESIFDVEDLDAFSPEPIVRIEHSNNHIVQVWLISYQKVKLKAKAAPKKAAAAAKAAAPKMSQTTLKPKKPAASKKRPKPDTEDEDSAPERDSLHDDSILSATPPSAKKQKKAPAPKNKATKPLQEVENEAMGFDGVEDPKPKKDSKSTETYQKVICLTPFL